MNPRYHDIHNHTLPGVDDGPKQDEDALRMAAIAAEDGIVTILLTPHSKDVESLAQDGNLRQRVEALRTAVAGQGNPVRILLGMEVHLEPDLPDRVAKGLALPINGSAYILVEFPFAPFLPLYTNDVLFQLQLRGLTPIIAHPERCDALVEDPSPLEAMVQRGMLAQVTTGSIVGKFGHEYQRAAETMLRRGLVQIIATDAHMARGPRVPIMSEGVREAARIVGEERAQAMATSVPQAILEGRPIPELPAPGKRRGLFARP